MNLLINVMEKIKQIPPKLFVKKIVRKFKNKIILFKYRLKDRFLDSRSNFHITRGLFPISLNWESLNLKKIEREVAELHWDCYKQHKFDILGSGWIQCGFMDNAKGFEGYRYSGLVLNTDKEGDFLRKLLPHICVKNSQRIWKLIDGPYQGIDWQKDVKSGYRWSGIEWYYPLKLACFPGGDIKVPWELGRLQHLPRLALFYSVLPEKRAVIWREYRNQILDFIAQNPVRWGVQSMCPMDMGIRLANIVLSYSLFASNGCFFDKSSADILERYIYSICNHIFHNLEKSDYFSNNHYLADLAGLLYGTIFLKDNRKIKKWKNYAVHEMQLEIENQFYEEGSNKEGSTAYHRLSSEIVLYSLAVMEKYQLSYQIDSGRLYGCKEFLKAILRPDGLFTTVGDNDSGVFFRLSFTGNGLDEEYNDVRPAISALEAFWDNKNSESAKLYPLEYSLMKAFLGKKSLKKVEKKDGFVPTFSIDCTRYPYIKEYSIPSGGINLTENIEKIAFPQFGLYIIRSSGLYLLFSLTDNGQNGNGGHAHNDKLSFELAVSGKMIFEDPGTYVYTALERIRDEYRSTKAHNTIWVEQEQNKFEATFAMKNETECKIGEFSEQKILAQVTYRNIVHIREIRIEPFALLVTDYCNREFQYNDSKIQVCRGYGRRIKILE